MRNHFRPTGCDQRAKYAGPGIVIANYIHSNGHPPEFCRIQPPQEIIDARIEIYAARAAAGLEVQPSWMPALCEDISPTSANAGSPGRHHEGVGDFSFLEGAECDGL